MFLFDNVVVIWAFVLFSITAFGVLIGMVQKYGLTVNAAYILVVVN